MALELWMQDGGHWFIDTDLGELMVGQAEEMSDGQWYVEVNDEWLYATDLEAAKRIFVERYDQALAAAQCGPGSSGDGTGREDFTIVRLPLAFFPSGTMAVDEWARLGVPRAWAPRPLG